MKIEEYIKKVIAELGVAEGKELPGTTDVEFDIGVGTLNDRAVYVNKESSNRIKFTIKVKRI